MTGEAPFKKLSLDVDLGDIAPHFQRLRFIGYRFIRNCMMCICAIVLLASLLSRFPAIPIWLVLGPAALLILGFLREMVKWCRPIEAETFRSHAGAVVFEVLREKGEESGFDAFIGALHAAITASQQSKQPNKAPEPTTGAVTPRATEGVSK